MTLDEIKKIESEVKECIHKTNRLRRQLKRISDFRKNDSTSLAYVINKAKQNDSYYQESNEAILKVEALFKHDFIRIAEMDLESQIRIFSTRARLIEKQISEYFDGTGKDD